VGVDYDAFVLFFFSFTITGKIFFFLQFSDAKIKIWDSICFSSIQLCTEHKITLEKGSWIPHNNLV